MPKIKPTTQEIRDRNARAVIRDILMMQGYDDVGDLSKICGFSRSTAYNRYNIPNNLKIEEIRRMKNITDDQIIRLIKG